METSPFRVLKQIVLSSLFAHAEVRDEVVRAFGTGIRFHRAFCRWARRYKVAKARTAGTDTDLMGTPLDELPPSVVFRMYDEPTSCNYEFRISDLLRIITTSLCNSPGLFAEPMRPRNSTLTSSYQTPNYTTCTSPLLAHQLAFRFTSESLLRETYHL